MLLRLDCLRSPVLIAMLIAAVLSIVLVAAARAQEDDDLERCVLQSEALFNDYFECMSQIVSYHAAKVTDPGPIISFAKRNCGIESEAHLKRLSECMGSDVAAAMAESEESERLLPHLLDLIENARKQNTHGDFSPPSPGDPYHAPMAFQLIPGAAGKWDWVVLAQGSIEDGTSVRFQTFLADHGLESGLGLIQLNSPGGLALPALDLGREIRQRGFSTAVASISDNRPQCNSACVFVFLGGVTRTAEAGQVGVHRFYEALALTDPDRRAYDSHDLAEVQKFTAHLVDYVTEMGVHPGLVSRAAQVPEDAVSYLTAEELIGLKVVTRQPN